MINFFRIILLLSFLMLSGCFSASRDSVDLVRSVVPMVESAKQSHLALVDEFIDHQRLRVDEFLDASSDEYWDIFYGKPSVRKALDRKYVSVEDREEVLRQISEAGAWGLYEVRKELTVPLDNLQVEMRRRVVEHYDSILFSVKSILKYLETSSEKTDFQEIQKEAQDVYRKYSEKENVLSLKLVRDGLNEVFDSAEGDFGKRVDIINEIDALSKGLSGEVSDE